MEESGSYHYLWYFLFTDYWNQVTPDTCNPIFLSVWIISEILWAYIQHFVLEALHYLSHTSREIIPFGIPRTLVFCLFSFGARSNSKRCLRRGRWGRRSLWLYCAEWSSASSRSKTCTHSPAESSWITSPFRPNFKWACVHKCRGNKKKQPMKFVINYCRRSCRGTRWMNKARSIARSPQTTFSSAECVSRILASFTVWFRSMWSIAHSNN